MHELKTIVVWSMVIIMLAMAIAVRTLAIEINTLKGDVDANRSQIGEICRETHNEEE